MAWKLQRASRHQYRGEPGYIASPAGPGISLEYIYASSNRISSLNGVENLDRLANLEVADNRISSLEPLSELGPAVTERRNNQVTSLSGLESLDELNDLTLSENALTEPDLTKISNATSLTYLNVSGTDLGSIVGIETDQLRDLSI